jgi:hypothetical protein
MIQSQGGIEERSDDFLHGYVFLGRADPQLAPRLEVDADGQLDHVVGRAGLPRSGPLVPPPCGPIPFYRSQGRLRSRWGRDPSEQLLALARFLKVPCEYLVDDAQEELPQSSERDRDDQVVLGFLHALGLTRDEALRRLAGPGAAEAGVPPIVAGPRKPTPAEKKASDPPIVAGPRKKGPGRKKADGAGGNRQGAG